MTVKIAPDARRQLVNSSGVPYSGAKLFYYAAGSTTKQNTYTDSTGGTPNSNPIVLDSSGRTPYGVWFTSGLTYKEVLAPSTDTDPPTSPIYTEDNLSGVNDTTSTVDQWPTSTCTPTYVSATSFTLVGDQTTDVHAGRQIKSTNTAGTIYSRIVSSVYTTLTTVTVVNASGTLDSGLSAVNLSILRADHSAMPHISSSSTGLTFPSPITASSTVDFSGAVLQGATPLTFEGSTDNAFETSFAITDPTADRTITIPDKSGTVAMTSDIAIRSFLSGCTLSTAGSSTTMSVSAGTATDSTNVVAMALAAIAKTTSAWAVGTGNGGIDTGAIANSTWYHFYVIQRSDTGVVDVVFSTSASAPTLPTNYTYYRRIGSGKTNGSAQWTKFIQFGDEFLWDTEVTDASSIATTTSAVSTTLTVPTGIQVWVRSRVNLGLASGSVATLLSSLDESDQTPTHSTGGVVGKCTFEASSGFQGNGEVRIRTNTSAQVRVRSSTTSGFLSVFTYGWVDDRGKSA